MTSAHNSVMTPSTIPMPTPVLAPVPTHPPSYARMNTKKSVQLHPQQVQVQSSSQHSHSHSYSQQAIFTDAAMSSSATCLPIWHKLKRNQVQIQLNSIRQASAREDAQVEHNQRKELQINFELAKEELRRLHEEAREWTSRIENEKNLIKEVEIQTQHSIAYSDVWLKQLQQQIKRCQETKRDSALNISDIISRAAIRLFQIHNFHPNIQRRQDGQLPCLYDESSIKQIEEQIKNELNTIEETTGGITSAKSNENHNRNDKEMRVLNKLVEENDKLYDQILSITGEGPLEFTTEEYAEIQNELNIFNSADAIEFLPPPQIAEILSTFVTNAESRLNDASMVVFLIKERCCLQCVQRYIDEQFRFEPDSLALAADLGTQLETNVMEMDTSVVEQVPVTQTEERIEEIKTPMPNKTNNEETTQQNQSDEPNTEGKTQSNNNKIIVKKTVTIEDEDSDMLA